MIAWALTAALLATQPMQNSFLSLGIGGNTCRIWTTHKSRHLPDRVVDKQWLAGFLSGVNFQQVGMGLGDAVRESDDFEKLVNVVDEYCAAHPLSQVSEAAAQLWLKLNQRNSR